MKREGRERRREVKEEGRRGERGRNKRRGEEGKREGRRSGREGRKIFLTEHVESCLQYSSHDNSYLHHIACIPVYQALNLHVCIHVRMHVFMINLSLFEYQEI